SDVAYTWLPPGATIPTSDPGTGAIVLQAKRAAALTRLPNDLIRYSTGAAEQLVRTSLVAKAALVEDLGALEGSGGGGVPLGVLNYPKSAPNTPTPGSITSHPAAITSANGDKLDPSDILTMLGLIEEANSPGATSWVMRPLTFVGLANARADA